MNKSYLKGTVIILIVTALVAFLNIFEIMPVVDFVNSFKKVIYNVAAASESFIRDHKTFAPLIFILIFLVRTFLVVFSCSIMIVIAGRVFGSVLGVILSMVAVYLSATLAFVLGRLLDKKAIDRITRNKFKGFDSKMETHGFSIIFFMRLSMLFPFDIVNYAAGMSKIRYREFILGTMLGIIPEMLSLAYLGDKIGNPFSIEFLISVLFVIFTVSVSLAIRRVRNKKNRVQ